MWVIAIGLVCIFMPTITLHVVPFEGTHKRAFTLFTTIFHLHFSLYSLEHNMHDPVHTQYTWIMLWPSGLPLAAFLGPWWGVPASAPGETLCLGSPPVPMWRLGSPSERSCKSLTCHQFLINYPVPFLEGTIINN